MKAAAVQYEPKLFRKEENLGALLRLAGEAARATGPGGLVVLPEMATTGYVFRDREEIAPYVEPVPGPATRLFGRLARERRVTLVFGLPEVDPATGAFYNSVVLVGPGGEMAGLYRKTHSFHVDTLWAAEAGLGLPVFPWPGPAAGAAPGAAGSGVTRPDARRPDTRPPAIGLLVCMDGGFFETARVLALKGAGLIAFPTNWLRQAPSPEWRARAAENGLPLVAANRWGEERGVRFAGGSCVIGPRGEILASRDRGDGVVVAEIAPGGEGSGEGAGGDAGALRRYAVGPTFGGLVRRRPELYHDLLRHPYLWPESYNFGRLGMGRFWLAAAAGWDDLPRPPGLPSGVAAGYDGDACVQGGSLFVLPPAPSHSSIAGGRADEAALIGRAAREHAYLAAAVGPREAVVLIGPDGPLGRYISPHLDPAADAFPVFDLPFARVGLLHALDLLMPEAPRLLAKKGVDVILVSGTWPEEVRHLNFLWAERAGTNDVWLATALALGGTSGEQAVEAAVWGERAVLGERASAGEGTEAGPQAGAGAGAYADTSAGAFCRRKDRTRRLRPELYLPLVGSVGGSPRRGEPLDAKGD